MLSPTVVSVPKCIKCLSLSDTIVDTDFVGAFVITVHLLFKGLLTLGSQVNVSPFLIVAVNIAPKLSSDQLPGSSITDDVVVCCPQPMKFVISVTVAPLLWAAVDVPCAPLVIPVKSLELTPVYVIIS